MRRMLPWEYGVRNLWRRPTRTMLTLGALTLVVFLVLAIVGLVRGLDASLQTSGDPQVVLVYALGAEVNLENSAIAANVPGLLSASIPAVRQARGVAQVSPELFLGTRVKASGRGEGGLGLVRGVTPIAPLVRRQVQITEGRWPEPGEVLVGRLVATKLGCRADELRVGATIEMERRTWRISGLFAADGGAFEAEIWTLLPDLQQALRRQDLSLAAVLLKPGASPSEVEIFCKQRVDLELRATGEADYYRSIQQHYRPLRWLAWLVAGLVSGAGVFAGLNLMYGAVAGRVRELATLQAIGFRRRAIVASIVQEGLILASCGAVLAAILALGMVHGWSVRFTMGAFSLRVDGVAVAVGAVVGLLIGVVGSLPPAWRALYGSVAEGIKAV